MVNGLSGVCGPTVANLVTMGLRQEPELVHHPYMEVPTVKEMTQKLLCVILTTVPVSTKCTGIKYHSLQ